MSASDTGGITAGTYFSPAGLVLLGIVLTLSGFSAMAQPKALTVMKNWQWPDYYDAPHEQQLRWQLRGAEARPQPDGRVAVQGVTLQMFLETGKRELLVELPECGFDPTTREASSPGPLRIQFQEGRFSLEGEGFWWQHTNALLVISNRVRTTIRGGWAEPQPSAPSLGDAQVLADRFTFTLQTTQAVYQGHVRVTGTNFGLACNDLSFVLPATNTGTVEKLLAEGSVAIDFGEFHATGDRAVCQPVAEMMQLTGGARWEAQGREGKGEELLLDGAAGTLTVNGGALLKLLLGRTEFIPHHLNSGTAHQETKNQPANHFVSVTSQRYKLTTNHVNFSGGVQVIERAGEEVRSRLICESLAAAFGTSNQLQTLVAERDVVIDQGERQLRGARLTYNESTGAMEIKGQPEWRAGERSGRGEVLLAYLRREEFVIRGNASLDLQPAQASRLFGALAGGATNLEGKLGTTNPAASALPTRITCDEYSYAPEAASFSGRVRVVDPRMLLTTDALALKIAPDGTNVVSIVADQNVVLSLVETNGQTNTVTCSRAVYTAKDGNLSLTGAPILRQYVGTNTSTFTAEVIVLNPATGEVQADRGIRSTVVAPVGSETNAPVLPFKSRPGRRKK